MGEIAPLSQSYLVIRCMPLYLSTGIHGVTTNCKSVINGSPPALHRARLIGQTPSIPCPVRLRLASLPALGRRW
eukprot:6620413-Pyramimonas_sp.AAC.3